MSPVAKALMSSARTNWQTPEPVLYLAREFFGGEIDLDPCTNKDNPARANKCFYPPKEDGLAAPWAAWSIWVNPPYGRDVGLWVHKCLFGDQGTVLT